MATFSCQVYNAAAASCNSLLPHLMFSSTLKKAAVMAFPLLHLWWQYPSRDAMDPLPEKDIQCAEEEDDEEQICWFLGEMLFLYCLAVAIIRIIYLGVNKILKKKHGGGTSWCNILKDRKGFPDCGCDCQCKFSVCGLRRKLAGGRSTASAPSIKKGSAGDKSPARSPSPKRQLRKKPLSKVGWRSCCESNSMDSDRVDSQLSWWSHSLSGDSRSFSSQKARRTTWKRSEPVREQPCLRCKARRTREWLAQHFFQPMFFPQEKSN